MIPQVFTQRNNILEYMITNGSITPLEALEKFGCFRLGARIFELRMAGYIIDTEKERKYGKRYARYVLKEIPNGQRY